MSRPVRLRAAVADRVVTLAASERRSFANMVEVLLLAALEDGGLAERGERVTGGLVDDAWVASTPRSASPKCSADAPRGMRCKLCGEVHK